ncbi:conserved hypothetical protein [Paenibacillus curdlanolyticus YK9]|uniref:Metallo-beta-lactamase domain-containing protein n=1 Tax=Paenibacillus curdlanolyticus YK9 TaxID=717606 RepID=E0I4P3_9BACL|nr:MBL fold metallo-hydrolase [Paenibacillus curdlanolyticus]EFM12574.1 conserved hypothetical protein [Paenibacillus curdlanolyticus YK9]
MIIQKLPWAGIRVQSKETNVVIDPLYHFPEKFGESHEPMIALNEFGPVDAVFVTHHHGDHFDPAAIIQFYGDDIPVFMYTESLPFASKSGLTRLQGVALHESVTIGGITATATYAVDGVGDPQVAWIIDDGKKKLIHSGDTLWHGYWWKIQKAYGPIDVACLPVNAAVVQFPGMTPSGQPITLLPEQAVAATVIFEAEALIPIHYKAVHRPPLYAETPNLMERLQAAAAEKEVKLAVLTSKETYHVK